MPRVSAYEMVEVGDALHAILERAAPLGIESVPLTSARGRYLARDVTADADLPGLPRSSVDGYAVVASDAATDLQVVEEVTAGRLGHVQVTPGSAVRIMTGGSLPDGTDAVVMFEDVEEIDGRAILQHKPGRGENVHPRGMDLTAGQTVVCQGRRIGPAEIGLLATVGCVGCPCFGCRAWPCWPPATSWSSRTRPRHPAPSATATGSR